MLTIETKLDPIEIDDTPRKDLPSETDQVTVAAHWNYKDRVIIEFHGTKFTVIADDLRRAIQNAINHD
jgi:hypothetical protein